MDNLIAVIRPTARPGHDTLGEMMLNFGNPLHANIRSAANALRWILGLDSLAEENFRRSAASAQRERQGDVASRKPQFAIESAHSEAIADALTW